MYSGQWPPSRKPKSLRSLVSEAIELAVYQLIVEAKKDGVWGVSGQGGSVISAYNPSRFNDHGLKPVTFE